MKDLDKVISALDCLAHGGGTYDCLKFPCPYGFYGYTDCHKWEIAKDALALLQEQEHKDRMYHALEDDWKRLKGMLKEQEAVTVHDPGAYCPKCGWMLYPEDHPHYCGNCGQVVKWE